MVCPFKVKVPYTQRTCTLCNSNDIEDEYHVTLVCEYFRDVRKKYIKPFYYQRPNMMKFLDLMISMVSHRGHNCISSALTILDSALTS